MKQFSWGAIFRGAIFLGGIFPGGNFLGGLISGGQFSRGHFSGGLFSRGHFSGHREFYMWNTKQKIIRICFSVYCFNQLIVVSRHWLSPNIRLSYTIIWPQACSFIKKETLAQVLFCEFCEISKNTFFYRTCPDDCFCIFNIHELSNQNTRWSTCRYTTFIYMIWGNQIFSYVHVQNGLMFKY